MAGTFYSAVGVMGCYSQESLSAMVYFGGYSSILHLQLVAISVVRFIIS